MNNEFIVFEGPDHSGKTTILNLAKEYMKENHPDTYDKTIFTREPGGIGLDTCESIRTLLLDPKNKMCDLTEAYLYAASRAEHCHHVKEWLMDGNNVVCDRFVYSSYVYQGIGKGIGMNKIISINEDAMDELEPNKILYFQVDFDIYKKRKGLITNLDRLELNNEDFFKRVIEGYNELFTKLAYYMDIKFIDASKSIEEVHAQVLKALNL